MATNNLILSLKILLISVTILSIAIILKLYLPLMTAFFVTQLPELWVSLGSWLTPPYLYVVINFIIITIAASSRYQQKVDEQIEPIIPEPVKIQTTEFHSGFVVEPVVLKMAVEVLAPEEEADVLEEELVVTGAEEFVVSRPEMTESMKIPVDSSFSNEKPPVSVRFGHKKIAKANPEAGKSLRVTKSKRQDTLESTWKMITQGRSIPLARQLENWETHGQTTQLEQVKKSETFKNRGNNSTSLTRSQGSGKLTKDPSLSQDELNRRVEAFITKFNEEMRLQRLESLNRYEEMIKAGGGPLFQN